MTELHQCKEDLMYIFSHGIQSSLETKLAKIIYNLVVEVERLQAAPSAPAPEELGEQAQRVIDSMRSSTRFTPREADALYKAIRWRTTREEPLPHSSET